MGQYYKAVCKETMESVRSWDHKSGAKLMEHSWCGNHFVGAVEQLLKPGGDWCGKSIVWAGDYADHILDENGESTEKNLYDLAKVIEIPMIKDAYESIRYLINIDKKQYIDLTEIPDCSNGDDWRIHPLPLLTCDNNGAGGSYYSRHNKQMEMVGKWCGDRIMMLDNKPKRGLGYRKIKFNLKE